MSDKHSRRKPNRSAAGSAHTAKGTAKAAAREKKAQSHLANISGELHAAIAAFTGAPAGSSVEKKARRAVRAVLDTVIGAKRKLKKAQKKLRKAVAKLAKTAARSAASPTKRKSAPTAKRQSSVARDAGRKPRHGKTGASVAPPLHRKGTVQSAAQTKDAAGTTPITASTEAKAEDWRDSLS